MGTSLSKDTSDINKIYNDIYKSIYNKDIDNLKKILKKHAYNRYASLFEMDISTTSPEIINVFLPYVDKDNVLRFAMINNADQSIIDFLKQNGASPPPILGSPDMKCSIKRYDCKNKDHQQEIIALYEKVKDQEKYLPFMILEQGCSSYNSDTNPNTYLYISTAQTSEGQTVLCGAMRVNDKIEAGNVYVENLNTISGYNPYAKAQKVGTMLIKRIIKDARKAGRAVVTLTSLDTAVGFYEKIGFKKIRSFDTLMMYTIKKGRRML